MSETITIDTSEPVRQRREAPERVMTDAAPAVAIDDTPAAEHTDPEAALAQVQQTVVQRDQQINELRRREAEAQRIAADAQARAAQTQQARIGDYAAQVDQAIAAATADTTRWRTAYRSARDAGDMDAELAAQEGMADARFRLHRFTEEKQRLGPGAPRQQQMQPPAPQPQPGAVYSQAAQQWIDAHPQFHADPKYRAIATAAHQTAVDDGITADSRAYFRHIEDTLVQAGYGEQPGGGQRPMNNGNGNRRSPSETSTAAPPSRGGSGSGGRSGSTVRTPMGEVGVTRTADSVIINIPTHLRADWEEGTRITDPNGWAADPKKALRQYALEQVLAGEEIARGGTGGLTTSEGRSYR